MGKKKRASGTGAKAMVLKCKFCGADVVRIKHLAEDEQICTSCIRGGSQWSSDGNNIPRRNRGRWERGRKDDLSPS